MDNESLAQYGTPLERLNEDNVFTAKALQPSNQIVTDKQGRRRFHGAFTGGFSAGFFNSVGSKEGWTPSTFVSSRSNRAEKLSQNDPSVYMDDEDLNSFGIASEQIQATANYGDLQVPKKRRKMHFERNPIPGIPVLEDLIKPVNTTMGMKLLMKLGWRPGQGIGPRVSGNQKNEILAEQARLFRENVDKVSTGESSESDEEAALPLAAIGFAPDDVEYGFWKEPKADFFGLGYKPLDKSSILGGKSYSQSLKMIEKRKRLSIKGQAFGVGVFEDDDDDIYAKEDMSDYDFILTPSEENKRGKNIIHTANVHSIEKELEGFCLSQKNLPKQIKILLPQLPLNFTPYHESYSRRFDRRDSVISYRPSAGDRNRILFHQPSVEVRSGVKKPETSALPINSSFQNTFMEMPLEKCLPSATESEEKPLTPSPGLLPMTKKESEREPFEHLGELQKPFSLAISSRFVSSSSDEGPLVGFSKGLNTLAKCLNSSERNKNVDDSLLKEEMKEDVKAAKIKMFGPLTQTSSLWQPDKILSKRFNVPHPFPNSSFAGVSSQLKEKPNVFSSISDLQSLVNSPQGNTITGYSKSQIVESEEKNKEQENLHLNVSANDPPTLDLFKAIFDNSSSESEEDCEVQVLPNLKLSDKKAFENVHQQPGNGLRIGQGLEAQCESPSKSLKDEQPFSTQGESASAISQEQSDSSRAKGLFKGIDFTALNQYRVGSEARKDTSQDAPPNNSGRLTKEWSRSKSVSSDENQINHERRAGSISPTLSEDEYGPEPPPHLRKGGTHSVCSPKREPSIYSVLPAKLHASKKKKHKDKHKKAKKKKKESKKSK